MTKLTSAQDAIKQAISEGWVPHGMEDTPSLRTPDNVFANFYHQPTFLLDPLFWQALGKARHWLKRNRAWAAYDKWNEGREEMYYAHFWFKTRMSGGNEKKLWESLP
jgi:hypothetical protein